MSLPVLLESLVREASPSGRESAAAERLLDAATEAGFAARVDDMGNVRIHLEGDGARLWLVGHIDTVQGDIPVGVRDGELWGRGTVDAKGPLVAAFGALQAWARQPVESRPDAWLIACVGEEADSRGCHHLLATPPTKPDAVIVLEPSGADGVCIGYKGILRAQIRLTRPSVHGGHPDPNAADAFIGFWHGLLHQLECGPGFERLQARIDALAATDDGMESSAEATVQFRLPPTMAPTELTQELEASTQAAGATLHVTEATPAVQCDRQSRLLAAFRQAIRQAGDTPRVVRKTGTADLNLLAAAYRDTPMVAYGPGDSQLDHAPDERVSLEELERGARVLARVGEILAGVEVTTPS